MKRFIAIGCVCLTLFSSISNAFVKRNIDIICEEIIPFNITSDIQDIEEYISLKEYNNVKIIDYYVDNGEIEVETDDDTMKLLLSKGKYINESKIITKTENIHIEENLTNEEKRTIIFEYENDIKDIKDTTGDFNSARIIDKNKIEIFVDKNADGIIKENKDEIMTSEIRIEIPADNEKNELYSDYFELPYTPLAIENVFSTNGSAEVDFKDDKVRVFFSNGIPTLNESKKVGGYTYFWADRAVDGSYRNRYPNNVYRSDKKYFTGKGEYIEGEEADIQLAYELDNKEEWKDYAGVIIDDVKYMYVFDNGKDIPDIKDRIILKENKLSLDGQWCNSEHLEVEFEDNLIRYIPNGRLYSMGEIVEETNGWGETVPNHDYESNETFYNPINGKIETYVKHFKFFFGPKEKIAFGGYFTYPYSAVIEYEHYKPVKLYFGNIICEYEEEKNYSGYNYSGWVKINYSEKRIVNDYPPTPPYNVCYNEKIVWSHGSDDYTPEKYLKYEVEAKINEIWQKIYVTKEGENECLYQDGKKFIYRIRTIDDAEQVSDWAYLGEKEIELEGNVIPQTIYKGEEIDISAVTRSITNITKVEAKCKELGINQEMLKISESIPDFNEISFEILCNYSKNPYINTKNDTYAYNDENGKIIIRSFSSDALTDGYMLRINLPETIKFNESGTVILPNQNYLNSPIEFSKYGNKWWYLKSRMALNIKNKNTNKEENFIYFINDISTVKVGNVKRLKVNPYIKLNTFKYDNGSPIYLKIPIESQIAGSPVSITWNTVNNLVIFNIFFGDELIYVHTVNNEELKEHIEGFVSYDIGKSMYLLRKTTSGFNYASNGEYYIWTKMKQAGSVLDFPWLGYKLKTTMADEDILEEYNNLPTTRDVNRLLFMNKSVNVNALKRYLKSVSSVNLSLKKGDETTVFASDARERVCEFELKNILTDRDVEEGVYFIEISAYDDKGNIEFLNLPVNIIDEGTELPDYKQLFIGRFFYDDMENRFVEELSKLKKSNLSEGFISAGETLAISLDIDNTDYLEIDIIGNESIKTYDNLTKRFLEDEPRTRGEEIPNFENNYNFPQKIYPSGNVDNEYSSFLWLYKIPYGTKQTLESWATIREKEKDTDNIDKSKLLTRISDPYEVVIKQDDCNDNEIKIKFDVFERWDTVLNHDVSSYLSNYLEKWRIEI